MSFAERNGFSEIKPIQVDDIDWGLRNRLFNALHTYWEPTLNLKEELSYVVDKLGYCDQRTITGNWHIIDSLLLRKNKEIPWYMPYEIVELVFEAKRFQCKKCENSTLCKHKYKVYYKIYEKVDTDGNPLARELPFHTLYLDGYTNRQAVNDLKKLFNKTRVFDYPKPIGFLKEIVSMASKGNCIVMDFFSGSGGFAQAVMQLNAEDGGHRKFIMVQLPEKCDETSEAYKAGYKNICEIGKERIRRAGEKIKAESPMTTQDLDIGFRVLKLDDTNMKDVYYAADDYSQDMIAGLESNIKDDRTDLDLLFGCLIDWGLPLSLPYRSEQMDGCTVHTYNGGDLIACFDANIPESVVKTIAKRKPLRAVFRDSGFASSPEKINVFEIFKLYMPEDAGDITKRVRVI